MTEQEKNDKQLLFENDMRINYISFFATLVASNIDAYYHRFGNNHEMSLETIMTISQDIFTLTKEEQVTVYKLITKTLKDEYKLEIVTPNELVVKKFE